MMKIIPETRHAHKLSTFLLPFVFTHKFTCICCVLLVLSLILFPCLIYCENTFFFVDASFRVSSKLPGSWVVYVRVSSKLPGPWVLYIRGFKISTKYGNFVLRWHSTNYNTFTVYSVPFICSS